MTRDDPADSPLPAVVVLISGRGSNLAALLGADLPVRFGAVLSNRADAVGLQLAQARGIPTQVLDHRSYPDREAFDKVLGDAIETALGGSRGLVVLAGFMRILTAGFTERFAGRMINIHPSLLPSFTGLHTHRRALQAGVRVHGCSVHFVTAELDHGPIIGQAAVPVLADDDEAALAARVLRQEHQLYPRIVRAWAEGRLRLDAGQRVVLDALVDQAACLRVPA